MTRSRRSPADDEPNRDELQRLAMELGLTSIPPTLDALLAQAEQDAMSYGRFAHCLLRNEQDARYERRCTRNLKRSHLGPIEGIEGFDFTKRPKLEARVIRELATCRFIEDRRNVVLVGRPGLGKTRIAKALGHAACLHGHSVRFSLAADMLEDLHASLADGSFKTFLRRFTKPSLLVLDEVGYQPYDNELSNYLFRVVAARHKTGSIVLTANTGVSKWASFFAGEAQAIATVDRLLDHATILRFTGKSFRQPRDIHGASLGE